MINKQLVIDAMYAYVCMLRSGRKFTPQDLVNYMEPVFSKAGYRCSWDTAKPPEILVIRTDAAGDFILFSPFLRELRRIYAGAHITLFCSYTNKELAKDCPYVDAVLPGYSHQISEDYAVNTVENAFEQALGLLKYNFDLAFSPTIQPGSFTNIIGYMSGASQHIGISNKRIDLATGALSYNGRDTFLTTTVPFIEAPIHEVDRSLMILEYMLKCPLPNHTPELWFTEADSQYAEKLLAPLRKSGCTRFICTTPTGSLQNKCWPIKDYRRLFNYILSQEPKTGLLIMGGPSDTEICNKLAAGIAKGRAIVTAGKCSFAQSAALVSRLNLYIGSDTCLLHMSAAAGLPVLSPNCFPMSLGLDRLCFPVRYAPYRVPAVLVLPAKPKDGCADHGGHGCSRFNEVHCILGIGIEDMKKGYALLQQKASAKDATTLYLQSNG